MQVNLTHVGYVSCMTPFSIITAIYYIDISNLNELTVSLDEWLTLFAGVFFFPFPTQWFATILSATEMTKLGHNNPFLFTVLSILRISQQKEWAVRGVN